MIPVSFKYFKENHLFLRHQEKFKPSTAFWMKSICFGTKNLAGQHETHGQRGAENQPALLSDTGPLGHRSVGLLLELLTLF